MLDSACSAVRVAFGRVLYYPANKAAEQRGFLIGMKRPGPGDPIFDSNVIGDRKKQHCYDSIDVHPSPPTQVHREIIHFNKNLVFPEYVVYYQIDDD